MPAASPAPLATRPRPDGLDRLKVPPLDLTRPAGPQIFQALRGAILRMELPPGCAISEAEVGARFGASRTPVREAFAELRDAGLVETQPSRGSFVTRLNAGKIREARFLREALEMANVCHLAREGFGAAGPAAEAAVEAALAAQAEALQAGDDMAFQAADDAFHLALAEATGHPRAAHVLAHEKMQLDRLRVLALRDRGHLEELLAEHRAIVAAIRAGDPEAARAAAERHLRSILGVLAALAARHAEYFDAG